LLLSATCPQSHPIGFSIEILVSGAWLGDVFPD
jgi:hypothetical protein